MCLSVNSLDWTTEQSRKVQRCNVKQQAGAVENSIPWRDEESGSSVWTEIAPLELSSRASIATSATVCRNNMTSHTTLDDASTPMLLLQQPVRWVDNVSQSEQGHIINVSKWPDPIWTHAKKQCGKSALKIRFAKESDLNQIPLQSECSFKSWLVWVLSGLSPKLP